MSRRRKNHRVGEEQNTKIDEIAVLIIRSQAGHGVPQEVLAERFGIGQSYVSRIVKRQRWSHI